MNRSWFLALLMFTWLTVGYATVYVVASIWGISIVQAIWPNSLPIENLHITEDGEVIISSYTWNYTNESFRRLDGTLITDPRGIRKTFNNQVRNLTVPELGDSSSWQNRINAFYDFQKPATCWYCVAPPHRSKTAFFVGFDRRSRRKVGYLGLNGFSLEEPDIEHSFPISPANNLAFNGVLTDPNHLSPGGGATEYGESIEANIAVIPDVAADTVWLLSHETIYEIRLGARTVRIVVPSERQMQYLSSKVIESNGKPQLFLTVRTQTGLLTIDPNSGETRTSNLDAAPPNSIEWLYDMKSGQNVLVRWPWLSRSGKKQKNQILWLDAEGNVERRAEVELFGYPRDLFTNPSAAFSLALPIPLVSFGAIATSPAWFALENDVDRSHMGTISQFLSEFRAWLFTSLVIGVATGWACRRRERDVFGHSNWFWPILVGLCGWFGWIGYTCLRPLPARLPQNHRMPAEPEPASALGTEIYA